MNFLVFSHKNYFHTVSLKLWAEKLWPKVFKWSFFLLSQENFQILLSPLNAAHCTPPLSHRSALKCLLNSAEDTGTTRRILTRMSAWSNRPQTAWDICSNFTTGTEGINEWGWLDPTLTFTLHTYIHLWHQPVPLKVGSFHILWWPGDISG